MKVDCFILLMSTVLMTQAVNAGSELRSLIEMLHSNGTVSDAQYQRLLKEINSEVEDEIEKKKKIQAELEKQSNVNANLSKGGLRLETTEGEFAVRIGGRIQMDAAWYDEEGSEMGNGTEIRRARLYIQGKMYNDWGYKLQYDFMGDGKNGIRDAFLTYNGFEHVQLKAGHFKDPFMLQEQTSSKYITFTERALPDAFSAGRHLGALVSTRHKHWTAALGIFGDSVGTADKGKDEGWGLGGRLTYAPYNEKNRMIHLGVAGNYRNTGDVDTVRFKQQPETHVSGINIVDTGAIAFVDEYLRVGGEFSAMEGPLSIQSEYIWTTVEQNNGSHLNFEGWYAEAAYFITGESRNYKKGRFGGVSPRTVVGRGGLGAWQLAARYSSIDLNDGRIDGGEADSIAFGVNWFPTQTLRFSGNYIRVLDIDGGAHHDQEPGLFQIRGQWVF